MSFALSPGMKVSWRATTRARVEQLLGRFIVGRIVLRVARRIARSIDKAAWSLRRSQPRILLLVDGRNWAQDNNARQIARKLRRSFQFEIRYELEKPELEPDRYDLAYVFFWGSDYYKRFGFDPEHIVKGLSSHRWQDDPVPAAREPRAVVRRHLRDAATVVCPSRRLYDAFREAHPCVHHARKGYDPKAFNASRRRSGPMVIGWAGNELDSVKGFRDVIEPACSNRFTLSVATGTTPRTEMNAFYGGIDVLAVGSRHEGDPLPLIEAMAAGCFPVCTDVGIVSELIRHGENGLIVGRSVTEFAEAFAWCDAHLNQIRRAGQRNARQICDGRTWQSVIGDYQELFLRTLARARRPRFRNDDVGWDTPLPEFAEFCTIFGRHGLTQVHGVTLRGRTSTIFEYRGKEVAYEGVPSIADLPYDRICDLSDGLNLENRPDLIDYLRLSPDDIALHGLFHTDYSAMTADEQRRDIVAGLERLDRLFPEKLVRYFIPPFNRTNAATVPVCRDAGLTVLSTDGIHLEEALDDLRPRAGEWHRYHHHRFYPSSRFRLYGLSLEKLAAAFDRAFAPIGRATGADLAASASGTSNALV
jgi:glycosyltransferase involved in cell wall biosynthesis/peptidoglycan/xylan/chitin deacetylase (PgdA/CDA1 family)